MTTVTLEGIPMHTAGELPKVGSHAPNFTVVKPDLSEITLREYVGQKIILNIFPSLDTTVCAKAMERFNEIASKDPNLLILCISADLPFAQGRFCSAKHLDNIEPVSVFRHASFGENYGVLITDGPLRGLLARAVIALDEKATVIYAEQITEITEEPNYQAMIAQLGLAT